MSRTRSFVITVGAVALAMGESALSAAASGPDRTACSPDEQGPARAESALALAPTAPLPERRESNPQDAGSKASKKRPRAGGQAAAEKAPPKVTETFIDLTIRPIPVERSPYQCLVWAADGQSFYCASGDEIRRFDLKDLRQLARWRPENIQVKSLSPSAEGLLMLCGNDPLEIWVLDPETFKVRSKFTARDVTYVASVQGLSVAYAVKGAHMGSRQQSLVVLDLKKGTIAQEPRWKGFGFQMRLGLIAAAPDGKFLYSVFSDAAGSRLQQYKIEGTHLKYMGTTPPSRRSLEQIAISPDSKFVAFPVGRGLERETRPGLPPQRDAEVFVFHPANLSRPALTLSSRPECGKFLAFDPKSGGFVASGEGLIFFDRKGRRMNSVPVRHFLGRLQGFSRPDGKTTFLSLSGWSVIELPW